MVLIIGLVGSGLSGWNKKKFASFDIHIRHICSYMQEFMTNNSPFSRASPPQSGCFSGSSGAWAVVLTLACYDEVLMVLHNDLTV